MTYFKAESCIFLQISGKIYQILQNSIKNKVISALKTKFKKLILKMLY